MRLSHWIAHAAAAGITIFVAACESPPADNTGWNDMNYAEMECGTAADGAFISGSCSDKGNDVNSITGHHHMSHR